MWERYVMIEGVLHPAPNNWPTTSARCPVDGQRLLYSVRGQCFSCENEDDEHLFPVTMRAVIPKAERRCTCCVWEL